jgi:ribosomal-protein-alanine N-acetyltransferase
MLPQLSPGRREWRINNMESLATQELKIREVRTDDVTAISEIEQISFEDPFPTYFLSQLADANPHTFLVAVVRDKIVGYAVIDKWPEQEHLVSIAVIPESRRKGVGQALLDHLIEKMQTGRLRLEVRRSNKTALELYRKNGFIQIGVAHNYYTDGEDAIQMEKLIETKQQILATI